MKIPDLFIFGIMIYSKKTTSGQYIQKSSASLDDSIQDKTSGHPHFIVLAIGALYVMTNDLMHRNKEKRNYLP